MSNSNSSWLLKALEPNKPVAEMISFLLYGANFYLHDKQHIRTACEDELNFAWPYTSVLARACNKTNYAKYGLEMSRVIHDTHPCLMEFIGPTRTFRETDAASTGRGLDTGIEKVSAKNFVRCHSCNHA